MLFITMYQHKRKTNTKPREEIKNWVEVKDKQGNILKMALSRNSNSAFSQIIFKDDDNNFIIDRVMEGGGEF